jgi:hypothetical protein
MLRVIPEVRMFQRSLQILALIVACTLLLSSQCYAMCAASACVTSSSPSSPCHHHSGKSNDSAHRCQHQHSQLFGPEASTDVAKVTVSHDAVNLALPVTERISELQSPSGLEILKRPGSNQPLGTSVLALLSTLRI